MPTLREIRRRISSVRSTQQITKAMKMVAAAKLRRAQESILATRPYARKLRETIGHLMARIESSRNILLRTRSVEKVLVVVVTADRGLCGAFNSNIIRFATHHVKSYSNVELFLYPVGKKGYDHFFKRSFQIYAQKINFFNHICFADAAEIVDKLVRAYESNRFDRIEIIYNQFKSALQQNITLEQFLPFVPDEEIRLARSKIDFLYEPDKEGILKVLIPKHLNIQMWKILLESNAAEQGARMTAMESATENAEELIASLSLRYNRARQTTITKEISEIVGGAEALKER
jgi:F-type H+-transporting ATPase subunit gamma